MKRLAKQQLNPPTQAWQRELADAGYSVAAGVDEVGRGAWAGPVVAAAVILPFGAQLPGVSDSKLLSKSRRQQLESAIKMQAVAVGLGWVSAREVDRLGLSAAVKVSIERALANMQTEYRAVMLDGVFNPLADADGCTAARPKADATELAVAAASVVAKLARDRYMRLIDRRYPRYGFATHVGYGTRQHQERLQHHGPCPEHRMSYKPVAASAYQIAQ